MLLLAEGVIGYIKVSRHEAILPFLLPAKGSLPAEKIEDVKTILESQNPETASYRIYLSLDNSFLTETNNDFTLEIKNNASETVQDRFMDRYFVLLPGDTAYISLTAPQRDAWYGRLLINEQMFEFFDEESLLREDLGTFTGEWERYYSAQSFSFNKYTKYYVIHIESVDSEPYERGWRYSNNYELEEELHDDIMLAFFGNDGIELTPLEPIYESYDEESERTVFSLKGDIADEQNKILSAIKIHKYADYLTTDYAEFNGRKIEIYLSHNNYTWFLEHNNKKYLCIVTNRKFGNAWAPNPVYLFDISRENNIRLIGEYPTYSYTFFHDRPNIGIYPGDNSLCVLKDEHEDRIGTFIRAYKITDTGLEPLKDNTGSRIQIKYEFNKWDAEMFKVLEVNIP